MIVDLYYNEKKYIIIIIILNIVELLYLYNYITKFLLIQL